MPLLDRFLTAVRAHVNAWIGRAEDPERLLAQALVDMQEQLRAAKVAVAQSLAETGRLRDDGARAVAEAQDWERRAMVAVQEGRDDLAKAALVRSAEAADRARELHTAWTASAADGERLKASLRALAERIEEARRKKALLVARHRHAQVQRQLAGDAGGGGDSAFGRFAAVEEAITSTERRLAAAAEVEADLTGGALEAEFRRLEAGGAEAGRDVEARLVALKAQAALPPGGRSGARADGTGVDVRKRLTGAPAGREG